MSEELKPLEPVVPVKRGRGRPPKPPGDTMKAPYKKGRPTRVELRKQEMAKLEKKTTLERRKTFEPLNGRQWAEADALWETGESTLSALGRRFDRDPSLFANSFKLRGIVKNSASKEIAVRVKAEIQNLAVGEASILAARIKETKEEHYKMSSGLAKLTWSEMLRAKTENLPFSAVLNNLKSLDMAMTILKKAREERYSLLGMNDDNYLDVESLPDLVIKELTADQVDMLRNRDKLNIDDVEMEEDESEYDVIEESNG